MRCSRTLLIHSYFSIYHTYVSAVWSDSTVVNNCLSAKMYHELVKLIALEQSLFMYRLSLIIQKKTVWKLASEEYIHRPRIRKRNQRSIIISNENLINEIIALAHAARWLPLNFRMTDSIFSNTHSVDQSTMTRESWQMAWTI